MSFTYSIDIPTVNILGVNIAAIDMEWLLDFTRSHLDELSGEYICVSNVFTTVLSYENEIYRAIQNGSVLSIPDGGPLASIGKKRGAKGIRRTTGPDYMEAILKESQEAGWNHFFYGSTETNLNKIKERLLTMYPDIRIVGMYSPPFRELTNEEDNDICRMINDSMPDFVWVGLGAPKQEIWMAMHQGKIKGLMVGVGAAFDYCAGNIKRAPLWMQKNNMEWVFRLIQDPKRLFKKYLITNCKFLWNCVFRKK